MNLFAVFFRLVAGFFASETFTTDVPVIEHPAFGQSIDPNGG